MNREEKTFDAVNMMREIRNRLTKRYRQKPEERLKRLQAIRKKYGIREPSRAV